MSKTLWTILFLSCGLLAMAGCRKGDTFPASGSIEDDGLNIRVEKIPEPAWDAQGVGDFSFTDRTGKTITNRDLLGKPWIVGFIFTRCAGPCPRVTGQMKLLHERTGVQAVSLSVDPEFDTQEVLAKYAETYSGLEPGEEDQWYFLTGDKREIYELIMSSFKMPVKEVIGEDRVPGFEVIHSVNIMLVDANGRVVGKYNALKDEEMAKLRRIIEGKQALPSGEMLTTSADPEVTASSSSSADQSSEQTAPAATETAAEPEKTPAATPESSGKEAESSKEDNDAQGDKGKQEDEAKTPAENAENPASAALISTRPHFEARSGWFSPLQLAAVAPAFFLGTATTGANAPEAGNPPGEVPEWVYNLPAVNASLNGLATVLLLAGYVLVKRRRLTAHKRVMLAAFATSVLFLGTYLVYHAYAGSRPFPGTGAVRAFYLTILVSHIILAAAVPVLAVITIYHGLREQWEKHRRIAKVTFPIWVYVSITGVIIYWMLYHWPLSVTA